jgi:hypothetical protein
MIKMLTAFTTEIDDVDDALKDILDSLALKNNLLKHSVGIVHCYKDFIETGVIAALADALPFDIAGCTTMGGSVHGMMSQLGLTITVLTSDDVEFFTAVSEPITDSIKAPLVKMRDDLVKKITASSNGQPAKKPAVIFPFIPFIPAVGGDEFSDALQSLFPEVPVFGSVAVTNETNAQDAAVFFNSSATPNIASLIAVYGDVEPQFFTISVIQENMHLQNARITGAHKNVLQSINKMPAGKYLQSIGLAENGTTDGLETIPFVIDTPNGTQLIRALMALTPEDYIICGGNTPEGSLLNIAVLGVDDTLKTAEKLISSVLKNTHGGGLLMYSCASRCWALGGKVTLEMEKVEELIDDEIPYQFTYSAGEFFPVRLNDGTLTCQMQNCSIIVCAL